MRFLASSFYFLRNMKPHCAIMAVNAWILCKQAGATHRCTWIHTATGAAALGTILLLSVASLDTSCLIPCCDNVSSSGTLSFGIPPVHRLSPHLVRSPAGLRPQHQLIQPRYNSCVLLHLLLFTCKERHKHRSQPGCARTIGHELQAVPSISFQ